MKVAIKIEFDDSENLQPILDIAEILNNNKTNINTTNEGQQQITNPSPPRKYHCNNPNCKKEITKDVVAFCLQEENKSVFGGKVFCRECQEKVNRGDSL